MEKKVNIWGANGLIYDFSILHFYNALRIGSKFIVVGNNQQGLFVRGCQFFEDIKYDSTIFFI